MFRQISYARVPTSEPRSSTLPPAVTTSRKRKASPLRLIFRPKFILSISIFIVIIILLDIRSKTWVGPVYIFDKEERPGWLDVPRMGDPLLFRVAVISHPSEVHRRQYIRDLIFAGVPPNEIQIDYRFFVGLPLEDEFGEVSDEIWREQERHKDMVIIQKPDVYERISEKRYAALKWADSFSNASYDYFMTMDSDTFVRFRALARRFPVIFPDGNVDPRQQPIMIGRMKPHWFYWLTNVTDESVTINEEDTQIAGPKYKYPVGIGYIFSSFLVKILLSTQPPVPHHIHYPYDDVMIGSWIAALKNYHQPDLTFRYSKHSWNVLSQKAHPQPLLPSPVNTLIVDDLGWHDYPGRQYGHKFEGSISWNSVCIHHIHTEEIPMLRRLKEFRGEWPEPKPYTTLGLSDD
ncbi:hypothetical protein Clacol_002387 [Clathrus columnatus]|uniref:Hexosyltransferase n=1 Tax=Clathrus columnatus TaxID=1419009 RepID=A0AAV5A4K4_9AGAM|nr:hypothetical protein Clacol_002387 [Clathrus columnatus]